MYRIPAQFTWGLFLTILLFIGCSENAQTIVDHTELKEKIDYFVAQNQSDSVRYYGAKIGVWYQQKNELYECAKHYIDVGNKMMEITGDPKSLEVYLDTILQLPDKFNRPPTGEETFHFIRWHVYKAEQVIATKPMEAENHYQLAFGLLRESQFESGAPRDSFLINRLILPLAERMKNTKKSLVARAIYNYGLSIANTPGQKDLLFNQIALTFKVQGDLKQSRKYLLAMSGHNELLEALRSSNWLQIDLTVDNLDSIIPRAHSTIDIFKSIKKPSKEVEQWISITYKLLAQVYHIKADNSIKKSANKCSEFKKNQKKPQLLHEAKRFCKNAQLELDTADRYLHEALSIPLPPRIRAKTLVDSSHQALFQLSLQSRLEVIDALQLSRKDYNRRLLISLKKKKQLFLHSLEALNKALSVLLPEEGQFSLLENPDESLLYPENSFLEIFQAKATLLHAAANPNRHLAPSLANTEIPSNLLSRITNQSPREPTPYSTNNKLKKHLLYLTAALENYRLYGHVNRLLWNDISYQQTTSQTEEAFMNKVSHKAIQLSFQLFQQTGQLYYKQLCFDFVERIKNIEMLKVIKRINIEEQLPKLASLLNEKQKIKTKLADYLSTRLFNGEEINETPLELERQRMDVFAKIKAAAPGYHDLLYRDQQISFDQIRTELLGKNQAFIEYHHQQNQLYTFYIDKDTSIILRQKVSSQQLRNWKQQWQLGVYGANTSCNTPPDLSIRLFDENGQRLAQLLLWPLPIGDSIKRLIIVNDAHLQNLAFDLLPQKAVKNLVMGAVFYKHYPYILTRYAISSTYSASFLQELNNKRGDKKSKPVKKRYLFYTEQKSKVEIPRFLRTKSPCASTLGETLPAFKGHESLEKAIREHRITKFESKKEVLSKYIADCNICHIYTHGHFNDSIPERSLLAMHSERKSLDQKEILFAPEIYSFPSNPNLEILLLEGCSTGVEGFQPGKGTFSLARAFFKIGARSVTTSLWTVKQEGSNELIARYYDELKKGDTKDIALQNAKLHLLNSSRFYYPHFWGAYTTIGNTDAVNF